LGELRKWTRNKKIVEGSPFKGVSTPWNSEAKFVKKTFLISKWLGLGLGFEIKKVFEQIYSIGPGKSLDTLYLFSSKTCSFRRDFYA